MIEEILSEFKAYVLFSNKTQVEIAEQLDITQSHLSRILHDKRTPSMTLLRKIEHLMEEEK
jgi:transcriptional regulator with XRE-family HTH domain